MSEPVGPQIAETTALHEKNAPVSTGVPTQALEQSKSQDTTLLDQPIAIADEDKPKGLQFGLIMLVRLSLLPYRESVYNRRHAQGLYLTVYILCLDISIVAPALPVITNQFKDTSKATWYFSIFLAANTAFQPIMGPWYRFSPKWTFLASVLIFEVGSLICAVAGSSSVFIFGRALAGAGAAGSYIGVMTIIALITLPHEQTKYSNAVGGLYSLGAVSGPLIGNYNR